jgi:hypothetical protein
VPGSARRWDELQIDVIACRCCKLRAQKKGGKKEGPVARAFHNILVTLRLS